MQRARFVGLKAHTSTWLVVHTVAVRGAMVLYTVPCGSVPTRVILFGRLVSYHIASRLAFLFAQEVVLLGASVVVIEYVMCSPFFCLQYLTSVHVSCASSRLSSTRSALSTHSPQPPLLQEPRVSAPVHGRRSLYIRFGGKRSAHVFPGLELRRVLGAGEGRGGGVRAQSTRGRGG